MISRRGKQQNIGHTRQGATRSRVLTSWLDRKDSSGLRLDSRAAIVLVGGCLASVYGALFVFHARSSPQHAQSTADGASEPDPSPGGAEPAPSAVEMYLDVSETKGGIDDADVWMMTTVAMIPVAALVGLVVMYSSVHPSSGLAYVALGLGIPLTMFFALFFVYWVLRFNQAPHASVDTYNDLTRRFSHVASVPHLSGSPDRSLQSAADAACADVRCYGTVFNVDRKKKGLHWILGKGYIDLTRTVHRAEEALIMYEPVDLVIQDALNDQGRIVGSTIPAREDLLQQLSSALTVFDPSQSVRAPISGAGAPAKLAKTRGTHPPANGDVLPQAQAALISDQTRARVSIRDVRFAVNEFRDVRKARLIEARNELIARILLTGLATCLLLVFILIAQPPLGALRTGAILYGIGATMGLFAGLYADTGVEGLGEDYGNSYVRLFQAFLVSGLAAVAGVYIAVALPLATNNPVFKPQAQAVTSSPGPAGTATIAPTSVPGTPGGSGPNGQAPSNAEETPILSLTDVYNIDRYPFCILLAAIFGVAPGVVVSRLSQAAQQNIRDLRSSEQASAQPSHSTGTAASGQT